MANVGTATNGKTLIGNGLGQSPRFADIGTNSGLTAHGVVIAEGNSPFTIATPGVANTVLMSNGVGADPTFETISTAGGVTQFTPDSGGAQVPSAGNFNLLGTGSITTVGTANTITTELTGLTNHAVLVGAGTATITKVGPTATAGQILQSAGAAADPAFSTATYPSTTTGNNLLYSSANNVVDELMTNNAAVLTTDNTGAPVWVPLVDGELIIGSTAGSPAAASLTAGAGITITPGSNSITITATAAGFPWTDVTTATQSLAVMNGYVTDRGGGVTYTLPASGTFGDIIEVQGKLGLWSIEQNANQQIVMSSSNSTVGIAGGLDATNVGDGVRLLCITGGASTVWRVISSMGNITVT